jgi:hypothetical protein
MDIDFVEWREGRGVVALIETAELGSSHDKRWQLMVLKDLADRAGVPAYFVKYSADCSLFLVRAIGEDESFRKMNRSQFRRFMEKL